MTREPIILVGAGGHAKACIDVIEQSEKFLVLGLVGMSHEVGGCLLGYPILGTDNDLAELRKKSPNALITLGQVRTPDVRIRLFDLLKKEEFCLPKIISPQAYVSCHSKIGEGTIVMHKACVNAGASIGQNCILNTQSLIEHDVVVGNHCHISTAVIINGGVEVGEGTFIGSNSSVREMIQIGERALVGMGQVVIKNVLTGEQLFTQKSKQ